MGSLSSEKDGTPESSSSCSTNSTGTSEESEDEEETEWVDLMRCVEVCENCALWLHADKHKMTVLQMNYHYLPQMNTFIFFTTRLIYALYRPGTSMGKRRKVTRVIESLLRPHLS